MSLPKPTLSALPRGVKPARGKASDVLILTLIGTGILTLLDSRDLADWTAGLGNGPTYLALADIADRWDGLMAALGLTHLHDGLRWLIHWLAGVG